MKSDIRLKIHAKSTTLNSRNLRFLHLFGTAIAVLSLGLLALIGSRFIQQNQTPPAWLFATIFATVVYIVHAYRRTNSLAKEEDKSRIEQANQAFKQLGPEELSAGVSLRRGVKVYVLGIVVLAFTSAGIVLGWIDRWWLMLGFCSVSFFFVLKTLLKSLAHPVVLRIGPNGIEDYLQYGLIRNAPPGAIHGADTFYFVNLELAKLQSEMNEFGLTFNESAQRSPGWPQGSSQPKEPQR